MEKTMAFQKHQERRIREMYERLLIYKREKKKKYMKL